MCVQVCVCVAGIPALYCGCLGSPEKKAREFASAVDMHARRQ